jgi:hypothetical protein
MAAHNRLMSNPL